MSPLVNDGLNNQLKQSLKNNTTSEYLSEFFEKNINFLTKKQKILCDKNFDEKLDLKNDQIIKILDYLQPNSISSLLWFYNIILVKLYNENCELNEEDIKTNNKALSVIFQSFGTKFEQNQHKCEDLNQDKVKYHIDSVIMSKKENLLDFQIVLNLEAKEPCINAIKNELKSKKSKLKNTLEKMENILNEKIDKLQNNTDHKDISDKPDEIFDFLLENSYKILILENIQDEKYDFLIDLLTSQVSWNLIIDISLMETKQNIQENFIFKKYNDLENLEDFDFKNKIYLKTSGAKSFNTIISKIRNLINRLKIKLKTETKFLFFNVIFINNEKIFNLNNGIIEELDEINII